MTGAYQLHRTIHVPEQLSYAAGDAGFNLLWVLFDSFLLYFLVKVAHLPLRSITPIVFCSRGADLAAGLAFGLIGDRVRTRLGTYRPYLFLLAGPLPLCLILLFALPSHAGGLGIEWTAFWTGVAAVIFAALYSVGNAAYTALLVVMTRDEGMRVRIASLRFAFAAAAVLAVQYLALPVAERFGAIRGWTIVASICAVGCAIGLMAVVMGTRERFAPPALVSFDLRHTLHDAAEERGLGWLVLAMIFCLAALSCRGAASPFYLQQTLGQVSWVGSALAANPLAAFVACALIPFVVRRRRLSPILIACFCAAIGSGVCLVPAFWLETSRWKIVLLQSSFGIGTGLLVPTLFVLLASCEDQSSATLTPALLASVTLIALKVGSAAGTLLASSALTHANTRNEVLRPWTGVVSLFTWWPALLFGLTLFCLLAAGLRQQPRAAQADTLPRI